MRYMNEFDVQMAMRRHQNNPVVTAACVTMRELIHAADANSDGWAYWPKPARSAARLMELIEGDGTSRAIAEVDQRATPEAYRKAVAPIKAFRTRSGLDFTIAEVSA